MSLTVYLLYTQLSDVKQLLKLRTLINLYNGLPTAESFL